MAAQMQSRSPAGARSSGHRTHGATEDTERLLGFYAVEVLVSTDEDLSVGVSGGGAGGFAELILSENLAFLRIGLQDKRRAGGVADVEAAGDVVHRTPAHTARQPLLPLFLAGLGIEAPGEARFVEDVNIAVDHDSGADALRVFRVRPEGFVALIAAAAAFDGDCRPAVAAHGDDDVA